MAGLLADGWFYISSAGLLVSGVLFFFLLGQYRAAADAADRPEPEAAAEPHAPLVRPVWAPEEPASSAKLASVPADQPAETESAEPKREAAPVQAERRRENATGGVNPAVVYLQNIKTQLEEIRSETRDLAKRVGAITDRDDALIERLGELARAVADLKGLNAPAREPVEPAAAPKRAKKSEAPATAASPILTIEPPAVAAAPEPQAEPKPEPEAKMEPSADEAVRPDLKPAVEPPVPAESLTPAAEGPELGEKPRRGPVWPV